MTDITLTQRLVREARSRDVTILTHGQWGSKCKDLYASRRDATARGVWPGFKATGIGTVAQHITVTFDHGKLRGNFIDDMQTIEQIGLERFNSGVSYNLVVDMATGMVGVGQPLDSKGTHTVNDKHVQGFTYDQNLVARAIACMGMPGNPLSDDAQNTLVQLLVSLVKIGVVKPQFDYVPHSLFAAKDCPTDAVRDKMDDIYREAQRLIRKEMLNR
jgi:hypothetical protein